MNLHEQTDRIKEMMGITESVFLKRRVSMKELSHAFKDALNYATLQLHSQQKRGQSIPLSTYASSVITMTIDEIHPQLISDKDGFPYDEVFQYLTDTFKDQIISTYEMNT